MNVWILVYGVCAMPGLHCASMVHSSYEKESKCVEVMKAQNKWWRHRKIRAQVYCIRGSEVTQTKYDPR